MKDYINLPARQLSHLVKRYVQHRQASDLESKEKKKTRRNDFRINSIRSNSK